MANKTLNGVRIQHLNASSLPDTFVPEEGEIVIYNKDESNGGARVKIGDGSTSLANLPFLYYATDEVAQDLPYPVSSGAVYEKIEMVIASIPAADTPITNEQIDEICGTVIYQASEAVL